MKTQDKNLLFKKEIIKCVMILLKHMLYVKRKEKATEHIYNIGDHNEVMSVVLTMLMHYLCFASVNDESKTNLCCLNVH